MRALITGITGFVGSLLAEHLLRCGDDVLGVAKKGQWPESARAKNWPACQVPLVAWDIAVPCPDAARGAIESFAPDAIYHLAAVSIPNQCENTKENPAGRKRAEDVNVRGTHHVVQLTEELSSAASRRQVPAPRMLFVSTSHVYAVRENHPCVAEDAPLGPRGGYGETKLDAEQLVLDAVRAGRIDAVIARAFKHAGPRQSTQLIPAEWAASISHDPVIKVRSPESRIDLTDARDVVVAYRLLMEQGGCGEIYNVGSGKLVHCRAMAEQLAAISGATVEWGVRLPNAEPVANIDKLVARTGWQPRIPLEQTLRDTLDYFA